MRAQTILLTLIVALAGTGTAEAKRGFSLKGVFGSSKAPAAPVAPKPATPQPVATPPAAAAPVAAAPKPAPAAPGTMAPATTAPAVSNRSNTFIFVSTGRSNPQPANAAETAEGAGPRLPRPAADMAAREPAQGLIQPAGYRAPQIGASAPAPTGGAPGFRVVN